MNNQLRNDLNRFLYEERLHQEGMLRTQKQYADKTLVNILLEPLGAYSFSLRLMEVVLLKFLKHENLMPITGLQFWHDNLKIQVAQGKASGLGRLTDVAFSSQLSPAHVKYITFQILSALLYLHHNKVVARGLHPGNVWLSQESDVFLGDLSRSRLLKLQNMNSPERFDDLSFTSPEISLNPKKNFLASDIWSLGCMLFLFAAKRPLFSAQNSEELLHQIFETLGTPDSNDELTFIQDRGTQNWVRSHPPRAKRRPSELIPEACPLLKDLINRCLEFDPQKRITAVEAIQHEYFAELCDPNEVERGRQSHLSRVNFQKIFDNESSRSEKLRFVMGLLQS